MAKRNPRKPETKRKRLEKNNKGRSSGYISSPDPGGIILAGIAYYIWTRGVTGLLHAIAVVLVVLCGVGMFGGALALAHSKRETLKLVFGVLQVALACALVGYCIYSAMTNSFLLRDSFAALGAFFTGRRGLSEVADARKTLALKAQ
jgi:hypothetical protein